MKVADRKVLKGVLEPRTAAKLLRSYEKSAQVFSSDSPRLIDLFPNEWVAVYDGEIVGHGKNRRNLLRQLKRTNIPTNFVMLKYIAKKHHIMVLS
ncbi:MAG: DUF5678 domain-containing protein [Fimbriimonadaceae bacterium]